MIKFNWSLIKFKWALNYIECGKWSFHWYSNRNNSYDWYIFPYLILNTKRDFHTVFEIQFGWLKKSIVWYIWHVKSDKYVKWN